MARKFTNGVETNTLKVTGGTPGTGKVLQSDASGNGTWQSPAGGGDMLASTYDAAVIAEQVVGTTATQTISNKTLTTPKILQINNTAGQATLKLLSGSDGSNYPTVYGGTTGQDANFGTAGTDTNRSINLAPAGTGVVKAAGVQVADVSSAQTLTSKTLTAPVISVNDFDLFVRNSSDTSKQIKFDASNITTGNIRHISVPNADDTLVGLATPATLTSKTLTTPVLNGTPTGTGVATAATASTLALRDSSGNLSTVNLLEGYATTATAAGTTTLTVASNNTQFFTGSTTQTVVLPVTSTLSLGFDYLIVNNSTGAVTVQSSGANSIVVLAAGTSALFTCILTSGTTAASWSFAYYGATAASGKKLTASNTLILAGTDGTTMTFPSTSATIARTDAANTFTGHQTIEGVTSTGATGTGKFVYDGTPTIVTPTIAQINNSTAPGVKLQLRTQNDNSNTIASATTAAIYQQGGWGQILGNSTATMSEAVTFPTAYGTASSIFVVISWLGFKSTVGVATDVTGFDSAIGGGNNIGAVSISTSGFTAVFNSTGSFGARYHGYSWIAWGV